LCDERNPVPISSVPEIFSKINQINYFAAGMKSFLGIGWNGHAMKIHVHDLHHLRKSVELKTSLGLDNKQTKII